MAIIGRSLGIGAAVTVAAAVAVSAIPAQAASSPGWRKVFTKHYGPSQAYSGYEQVVAISAGNAWAIGDADESGATASVDVAAHWNGRAWKPVALPGGAKGYVTGASASSPSNVWVFGGGGETGGLGTWHYNGSGWTRIAAPTGLQLNSLASDGHGGLWFTAAIRITRHAAVRAPVGPRGVGRDCRPRLSRRTHRHPRSIRPVGFRCGAPVEHRQQCCHLGIRVCVTARAVLMRGELAGAWRGQSPGARSSASAIARSLG